MRKFIALILVIGIVGCSGEQEQEKEQSLVDQILLKKTKEDTRITTNKASIYRFICKDKEPVMHKIPMKISVNGDVVTNYADVDYHLTIQPVIGKVHLINKEPELTFSTYDDLNFEEDFNNTYDQITAVNSMLWKFTFDKFSGKAKILREPGNPQGAVNTYTCVKANSLIP